MTELGDIIGRRPAGDASHDGAASPGAGPSPSPVAGASPPRWDFSADGRAFRLYAEACRIRDAHLFDPCLAVHSSDVEPLPHQITAVYREMLGRLPLRYVLADDPGAGKTVMTGLLIRELMARDGLRRCLVVCPGGLVGQWRDELLSRFGLRFDVLGGGLVDAVWGGVFETPLLIARMDGLARSDDLLRWLGGTDWDLVVCDEAHRMSATAWGGDVRTTRRFELGRLLSRVARNFLLLTATPHDGKEEDFRLFLSLVDPDRFAGAARGGCGADAGDLPDVMRRMVKEDLRKFDGSPLFPDRYAVTIEYDLSPDERALYEAVTAYVRDEFDQADRLPDRRRTMVGFAMTVLQRRLASSPEAIWRSLSRRLGRLESRLAAEREGRGVEDAFAPEDADDDVPSPELERLEDEAAGRASAARTVAELEAEIARLRSLEAMARRLRDSGRDRKWEELSGLLQDNERMFGPDGSREKLIVFTEHRDTLTYLAGRIRTLLGDGDAVATIDGETPRAERRRVESLFMHDRTVRVLVATDAAGEGLNLQRAHLMVDYDLPWNPNRIEQRFGRIHRIGQSKACWLWNLVAAGTREGDVFARLFGKLEQERRSLGGKVFDVLGKVRFGNLPLRDLLVRAVRRPDGAGDGGVGEAVAAALDHDAMVALSEERALTRDAMDPETLRDVRESMERAEAGRLQPHFTGSFFMAAFAELGGGLRARERGRWEVTRVPLALRTGGGTGEGVRPGYGRVCLDRAFLDAGGVRASLVGHGHPLLDAVASRILDLHGDAFRRGAVLVDERGAVGPRLLLSVESLVRDGLSMPDGGPHVVSRRMRFVEVDAAGSASDAGPAPHLDLRPATDGERRAVLAWAAGEGWTDGDRQDRAARLAAGLLSPGHLSEVLAQRSGLLDRTERAVRVRLTAEIRHWDLRAAELGAREAPGKAGARLDAVQASRRAEELERRLRDRLSRIAAERRIEALPPTVLGAALVVPASLACGLLGRPVPAAAADAAARRAAMDAVMAVERSLGFVPRDVGAERRGYDVESAAPDGSGGLRFIAAKGLVRGADAVTVSRTEIMAGLNVPERFILALAETDGTAARVVYLRRPFVGVPDFPEACRTLHIDRLLRTAETIHEACL